MNSGRKKASYQLRQGDLIRVPPVFTTENPAVKVPHGVCELIEASTIYESTDLRVLDKPEGIPVHAGTGSSFGCIEAVNQMDGDNVSYLCHRLDKDTSGVLLIAKNKEAMRTYQTYFRESNVQKRYVGLVRGCWSTLASEDLVVSEPLTRYHLENGERRVKVDASGKKSETLIRLLQVSDHVSLLEFQPVTGRTHQIRVHAQYLGHALLGDQKYANDRVANLSPRLMLHASELELPNGLKFQAPLPSEFGQVWKNLTREDLSLPF